ncbi:MAG: hypothetical protein LBJ24_04640 [Treponema sp.]|jgi:hypothetical protein|nr:hypothetical protein [Treponema sp.]
MKKIILGGLPLLIFGFIAAGCATRETPVNNSESWNEIKSMDDLAGRWEGYNTAAIPANKDISMPESSMEVNISFEYIKGSKDVNAAMKVDMGEFLNDWLSVPQIREAGLTKDALWKLLVEEFKKAEGIAVGGKYYITYDLSGKADDFLVEDSRGKFQINNDGNKVRLIFYDAFSFGLGDSGFTEIVLSRKPE